METSLTWLDILLLCLALFAVSKIIGHILDLERRVEKLEDYLSDINPYWRPP